MPPCTYYTGIFPDLPHLLQVCISRGEPEADGSRSFLLCGINLQKGIVEVAMIEFALERHLFDGMLKEFSLKPYEDKMALERLIYDVYTRHKAIDCKFPEEFLAGMHIMHFSKNEVKKAALIAAFQHRSLSASIESGSAAKDFLEGLDPNQVSVHTSGNALVFSNIPMPQEVVDEFVDKYMEGKIGQGQVQKMSKESSKEQHGNKKSKHSEQQADKQDGKQDGEIDNKHDGKQAIKQSDCNLGASAPNASQEASKNDAIDDSKGVSEPVAVYTPEQTGLMGPAQAGKGQKDGTNEVEAIISDLLEETIGTSPKGTGSENLEDQLSTIVMGDAADENQQAASSKEDMGYSESASSFLKMSEPAPNVQQEAENINEDAMSKEAFKPDIASLRLGGQPVDDPFGLISAQQRVQDKINKLLEYKIPEYTPAYCKDWSREDWARFLNQDFAMIGIKMLHDTKLFTPLLYLLKHGLAPDLKADPEFMAQLTHLKTHPALTSVTPNFKECYFPSPDEVMALARIKDQFYATDNQSSQRLICKELEKIIDKYPANPYLVEQLYHFYESFQDSQVAFRLACRLYNSSTEREGAVSRYFIEICNQNKFSLVDQFLSKSILFERHLPDTVKVYNTHYYHQYYQALASHFANTNQWLEYLFIVETFVEITAANNEEDLLAILWNTQYLQAADYMNDYLLLLGNNSAAKNRLIDNIFCQSEKENNPNIND